MRLCTHDQQATARQAIWALHSSCTSQHFCGIQTRTIPNCISSCMSLTFDHHILESYCTGFAFTTSDFERFETMHVLINTICACGQSKCCELLTAAPVAAKSSKAYEIMHKTIVYMPSVGYYNNSIECTPWHTGVSFVFLWCISQN